MRTITIPIDEILSLIHCASDYGFEDDVLFDAFRWWLEKLTDEEIDAYANKYVSEEYKEKGYDEYDAELAKLRLQAFRSKYLSGK